jgi:hypothetical protein
MNHRNFSSAPSEDSSYANPAIGLRLMLQRIEKLEQANKKLVEALSLCIRYPEEEYGARDSGTKVLREVEALLNVKK